MIRFRYLLTLFTEIDEMVEINLAENNVLLVLFTCPDPEKYPDEEVGSRECKFADRVKEEEEKESRDT